MIYKNFQGKKLSALGLGAMRLLVVDGNDSLIDVDCRSCEQVCPQQIKISEMMNDFQEKLG